MNYFGSDNISCKPISQLDDLLNLLELKVNRRPYKCVALDLKSTRPSFSSPQVIVCHDMANNYHEDRLFQGSVGGGDSFNFYHWELIDMFVYFSHHLVTIPPEAWINAAHTNSVRCLGTFITEFDRGYEIWQRMITDDCLDKVVDALVDITLYYGFDGWLINIENKINNVDKLKYFVDKLNRELKKVNPDLYKVIWYDSVTVEGELKWQNELTKMNAPFFDLTDGIFLNYTWTEENLERSRENASAAGTGIHRIGDVYVGIDTFGRGCLGGGGYNCNAAFEVIAKYAPLSIALFAPGWVYETQTRSDFIANNERFWYLLSDYLKKRRVRVCLPLATTFSHGCGRLFCVQGRDYSQIGQYWTNLSLQSLLPVVSSHNDDVDWCFQDAFYGGNSILIKPSREFKIFDFDINLAIDKEIKIIYIFKDEIGEPDKFHLSIKYEIERSFKSLALGEDNSEVELKDIFESTYPSGWRQKTLRYLVKHKSVKFISVIASNKYEQTTKNAVKIGYLKISETADELVVKSLVRKPLSTTVLFTIEKSFYLCVLLRWEEIYVKYYNVFIDTNRNLVDRNADPKMAKFDFRYVGSTRNSTYTLCLKLSMDHFSFDSSLGRDPNERELSFNMVVQPVDEDSFCLGTVQRLERTDSSNIVVVREPRLVQRGDADVPDLKFYEKIVSGFEIFGG